MLNHLQSREEWTEKSLGAKGFTLIELLVVIIILGILAAVAIFAVGNIGDNAKKESCRTEKSTVQTAVAAYQAQYGATPASTSAMLDSAATNPGNLKSVPTYVKLDGNGDVIASGTAPSGCF